MYTRTLIRAAGLIGVAACAVTLAGAQDSKPLCPLWAAGGYAAGSVAKGKWFLNAVYAPGSVTNNESFLWYDAHPRLRIGIAYLGRQGAFRGLASATLLPETASYPAIDASAGVQGIGTGNPGYSLTAIKNWPLAIGRLNAYVGIGWRANERGARPLEGIKLNLPSGIAFGVQDDGHRVNPFATYNVRQWTAGIYLVGGSRPALLVGVRF